MNDESYKSKLQAAVAAAVADERRRLARIRGRPKPPAANSWLSHSPPRRTRRSIKRGSLWLPRRPFRLRAAPAQAR